MPEKYSLLSIEAVSHIVGSDPAVLLGLIEQRRLTAFVALPVVLALQSEVVAMQRESDPRLPPMPVRIAGTVALDSVDAAAIAAGHRTEVRRVWEYGDYLPLKTNIGFVKSGCLKNRFSPKAITCG